MSMASNVAEPMLEQKTMSEFARYAHLKCDSFMEFFGLQPDDSFFVQEYDSKKLAKHGMAPTIISSYGGYNGSCNDKSRIVMLTGNGKVKVGSAGNFVDWFIDHATVSDLHATIEKEGNLIQVTDMESHNKTYVGGKSLEPHKKINLQNMNTLQFGPDCNYRFFDSASMFYQFVKLYNRIKGT